MLIQLCPPFLPTFPKAEGEMFKQQLSDKAGGLRMGGISEARALDFLNQGGGGRGQGWSLQTGAGQGRTHCCTCPFPRAWGLPGDAVERLGPSASSPQMSSMHSDTAPGLDPQVLIYKSESEATLVLLTRQGSLRLTRETTTNRRRKLKSRLHR